MLFSPHGMIGRFLHRRSMAHWKAIIRRADDTDLAALEAQNQMAQRLMRIISNFRVEAESRLALPRPGSTTFPRPSGTDWSWRPKLWRAVYPEGGLAPAMPKDSMTNEVVIFHDCKSAEVSLRQTRNMREIDLSPYGLSVEAFHFDGNYLSIVVEIPPSSCEGLRKKHLIRLAAVIERERPSKIYARLNVKNGPNTEQILLTLPDDNPETMVEFDLAYSQLNEQRAERMWVDLMIESPAMNKITFRDLNFSRYPRAEI
jgi:hypothetical protein